MCRRQVFNLNKNLYLFGPINRKNSNDFVRNLLSKDAPRKIILSSEGGSVSEAIKICEALRFLPGIDVRVQGEACSAATLILASATGNREMTRHSYLMYHLPSFCSEDDSRKTSLTHRRLLDELSFTEELLKPILLKRNLTNKKALSFYQKFTSNDKDFYLSSKEALDLGLIDKII